MTPVLAKNLADFDDLDFHVYTGQHWDDLHKSHAEDIIVYYPDGHTTKGIPAHIKELDFMWTFAPDNRIVEHPVRFGTADGEWTGVMGYLDGTFSQNPWFSPEAKPFQPYWQADITYRCRRSDIGITREQCTRGIPLLG